MSQVEECARCKSGELCNDQNCFKNHCEQCTIFRKYAFVRKYSAQDIAEYIGTTDQKRIESFVDRLKDPHKMIDEGYEWTEQQALTVQLSYCMTDKEFYEYHLKNPSTWKLYPKETVDSLAGHPGCAMDDQGFEGYFTFKGEDDGEIIFHRWVQDNYNPEREARLEKIKAMSDQQLEDSWQSHCQMIQSYLMQYYSTKDETFANKAREEQILQSEIQDEISRRAK